jgi:hypothetical protein
MDELRILGTALTGPEPSPEAVDRSRHRLQNVMRGGRAKPRRTRRWIAAGVVVTAAAAPVAYVEYAPGDGPLPSGRQVMLTAADSAASKPPSTGTYWHTKLVLHTGKHPHITETWIRRDGRTWLSAEPGFVSPVEQRPMIEFTSLDYARIQRLPTDPEKLKSALLNSYELRPVRIQRQIAVIDLLQSVLSEAPAPPKVRAAAYRALAALPHIANLGRTKDGYRLRISYMNETGSRVDGTETLVVDPKSTRLRVEGWAGFGDGALPAGPSRTTSEWTDRLPGRIVPWKEQEPYIERQNKQEAGQNP